MISNKYFQIIAICLLLILHNVRTDCTDEKGNPIQSAEDGVGGFFRNLGCSIQRGAQKVGESAKKLGEKETWQKFGENIEEGAKKLGDADTWKNLGEDISEGAKRFGTSVKNKYSDIKDKLSGQSSEEVMENFQNKDQQILKTDS